MFDAFLLVYSWAQMQKQNSLLKVEQEKLDKAWIIIIGNFLRVVDQFRIQSVSKKFQSLSRACLNDETTTKYIKSDEEVKALVSLGGAASCVVIHGGYLTQSGFSQLFGKGSILHITVIDCESLNDEALSVLAKKNQGLQSLVIDCRAQTLAARNGYNGTRPTAFTSEGLKQLAGNCLTMKKLALYWCRTAIEEGIAEIVKSGCLESLHLSWTKIGDQVLESLVKDASSLKNLHLSTSREVTKASMLKCFSRLAAIESLELIDIECTDEVLKKIGEMSGKSLKSISLSDIDGITDAGLKEFFSRTPNVEQLHLSHLNELTSKGLTDIITLISKSITTLELFWLPKVTNPSHLLGPDNMPQLQSLKLDGLREMTEATLSEVLQKCPKLRFLQCLNAKASKGNPASLSNGKRRVVFEPW